MGRKTSLVEEWLDLGKTWGDAYMVERGFGAVGMKDGWEAEWVCYSKVF